MLTIGLILLDADAHLESLIHGSSWKAVKVFQNGVRKPPQKLFHEARYDAFAIVGSYPEKVHYAKKALSLGKHVLVDFPAGKGFGEVSELHDLATTSGLCFFSPNLMRSEPGFQVLKDKIDSPSKLLSVTVTWRLNSTITKPSYRMRLVQLIDLVEWIADSRYSEALSRRSKERSTSASIFLLSLHNGVKALINIYWTTAKAHSRMWMDAILEDSVMHIAPYAQSLKVEHFKNSTCKEIGWAPSPLSFTLDDFASMIKRKKASEVNDLERLIKISQEMLRSQKPSSLNPQDYLASPRSTNSTKPYMKNCQP
jgi:predicted dehydrogenase